MKLFSSLIVFKSLSLLFLLQFWNLGTISAQSADDFLKDMIPDVIDLHRAFVSLPNDAQYPEDMVPNLDWMEQEFEKRGFNFSRLSGGAVDLGFAEYLIDESLPTVLFYLHFDGQPVDPTQWNQEDPFIPVVKMQNDEGQWQQVSYEQIKANPEPDARIFARAAADDKGPIIMFLAALDVMQKKREKPAYNIKVLLDGQEEKGSSTLKTTLDEYAPRYKADHIIIMDGPAHPSNLPTLTFGCRGIARATLKVYGPKVPQHSGHYGNYAPNPGFRLSNLMSGMKDEEGRVLIDGFYDGVEIDELTKAQLAAVPDNQSDIMKQLGIAESDQVGETYQESLQYPSLNIRGMSSGWTGNQTRTIVPDVAVAELGIRLVPETSGDRLLGLVKDYIKEQGYYLIDREPTQEERLSYPKIATFTGATSVNAFRTPFESETGQWLTRAIQKNYGQDPVRLRTMGGTVPVVLLIEKLQAPAVILPLVNMDNNQHSPNENLRLGNLIDGVKACYSVLVEPIGEGR